MSVFSEEESALLDQIAIESALDRLSPLNRTLVTFYVAYEIPHDYEGPWPPRYADTGAYIRRHLGKPLRETGTRVRTNRVLAACHRLYRETAVQELSETCPPHPLRRAA